MAGNLSGGEQQMLALGGALMTRPELLMIDELSLGLAPTIVGQLLEVVREIHRRGTTIVIVEQSVNVALNLAERAVFMEKGEVRFEGADRRAARAARHPALGVHRRRRRRRTRPTKVDEPGHRQGRGRRHAPADDRRRRAGRCSSAAAS